VRHAAGHGRPRLSPRSVMALGACFAACVVGGVGERAAGQDVPVDLELGLLLDVSGSVDGTEFALQRDAYVSAFRDPVAINTIQNGTFGRIAVTLVYWSGTAQQQQTLGFTVINNSASSNAFADAIAAAPRPFSGGTAIGSALNFTTPLFDGNGYAGTRVVIDVSGDGPANQGADTPTARDAALAAGIDVVNGLTIGDATLEAYYNANVIGGEGAFVIPAPDFATFEAAIIQKLVTEIGAVEGFEDLARTPTQKAVGRGLDTIGADATGELANAIVDILDLDDEAAQRAFLDQLAGAEYALQVDLAFDLGRLQMANLGQRLEQRRRAMGGGALIADRDAFDPSTALALADDHDRPSAIGGVTDVSLAGALLGDDTTDRDDPDERARTAPIDPSSPHRRFGVFAGGRLLFGDQDGSSAEPRSDFIGRGVTVGVDYRLTDSLVVGVAGGYAKSDGDLPDAGEMDVESYTIALFGTAHLTEALYVDALLAYAFLDYQTKRTVILPGGAFNARSDADGAALTFRVRGGYDFVRDPIVFGPTVQLDYQHIEIDAFRERGAGTVGLRVDEQEHDSVALRLGGQATWPFEIGDARLAPQLRAEYVHEFADDARSVVTRFNGSPAVPIALPTEDPDRDYFTLGGGISALLADRATLYFDYTATLGQNTRDLHALTFGLRLAF